MQKMTVEFLRQPNHGGPFTQAAGAFYRSDNPDRLCTCLDCQESHRRALRTPDSPFHQGMIVQTPGGLGIVYQTNQETTAVDLVDHGVFYVVKYETKKCREVA